MLLPDIFARCAGFVLLLSIVPRNIVPWSGRIVLGLSLFLFIVLSPGVLGVALKSSAPVGDDAALSSLLYGAGLQALMSGPKSWISCLNDVVLGSLLALVVGVVGWAIMMFAEQGAALLSSRSSAVRQLFGEQLTPDRLPRALLLLLGMSFLMQSGFVAQLFEVVSSALLHGADAFEQKLIMQTIVGVTSVALIGGLVIAAPLFFAALVVDVAAAGVGLLGARVFARSFHKPARLLGVVLLLAASLAFSIRQLTSLAEYSIFEGKKLGQSLNPPQKTKGH